MHLLMHGHFWSREKDGGHIIRSTIAENYMLHANLMAVCCIEPELPLEVLHYGNTNFLFFCSCDLMTFIYKANPYSSGDIPDVRK